MLPAGAPCPSDVPFGGMGESVRAEFPFFIRGVYTTCGSFNTTVDSCMFFWGERHVAGDDDESFKSCEYLSHWSCLLGQITSR